jgi:hypothetical protein
MVGTPTYNDIVKIAATRNDITDDVPSFRVRSKVKLKTSTATLAIQTIGFKRIRNNPRRMGLGAIKWANCGLHE